MKNTLPPVILLLLLLLLPPTSITAAPSIPIQYPTPEQISSLKDAPLLSLPNFAGTSDLQADKLLYETLAGIGSFDSNIVKQLNAPNITSRQKSALYYLAGEFRISVTIDRMINDIQFAAERNDGPVHPIVLNCGYVAEEALSDGGLPVFRAIMEVMSDKRPGVPYVDSNMNSYAWVLWSIEGKKYAILRLKDQMLLEKDPKVLHRYQMVIDSVSTIQGE